MARQQPDEAPPAAEVATARRYLKDYKGAQRYLLLQKARAQDPAWSPTPHTIREIARLRHIEERTDRAFGG